MEGTVRGSAGEKLPAEGGETCGRLLQFRGCFSPFRLQPCRDGFRVLALEGAVACFEPGAELRDARLPQFHLLFLHDGPASFGLQPHLFRRRFLRRIGGLVNFPHRAEIIFRYESPKGDFFRRYGGQAGIQPCDGFYPGWVQPGGNVHGRNHADVAPAGEFHLHPGSYCGEGRGARPGCFSRLLRRCAAIITRLPLQPEWEYHLYAAPAGHYWRLPSSAALIMFSLAVM